MLNNYTQLVSRRSTLH